MSSRALVHVPADVKARPMRSVALLAALSFTASAQIVFEPPVDSDGGNHAVRVLLGDVDGDLVPDALVAREVSGVTAASISLGLGDGAFGRPSALALGGAGRRLRHLADFDEDGTLDLLTIGGAWRRRTSPCCSATASAASVRLRASTPPPSRTRSTPRSATSTTTGISTWRP
ncbi:MAG: FG-GAP repeat domain-containing protein [Planctomycetota bacterium]|jgi:hypothetical protein